MRDPKRIDKFCDELKTMWKSVPDQRFGQLMVNFFGFVLEQSGKNSVWRIEEDEMLEYVKKFSK